MQSQSALVATEGKPSDLFALSDEQILDITPEATDGAAVGQPSLVAQERPRHAVSAQDRRMGSDTSQSQSAAAPLNEKNAQPEMAAPEEEPPAWLAAQMKDAWGGEEAREFWNGVQQARSEAAAYRAAIASPEDARALKELYPGGVTEARGVAERARLLDDVDRAYFGATGNSPEQTSASRVQLAQRMLREDPAAFREMVEAGVRVLQEAASPQANGAKSLASLVSDGSRSASAASNAASVVVAQHAVPLQGNHAAASASTRQDAHVASYAAFEQAANDDLERSVGAAIDRTLTQALPSVALHNTHAQAGAQRSLTSTQDQAAPLRERLAASVRADVEKGLQGDRQLGEQVAQILASRRFDNDSRAQIVRLIGDRAQQLVPGAAKRVLNEWTQTTLAAHQGRTQRLDAASARADVTQASAPARSADSGTYARRQDASSGARQSGAARSQPINYRKLSDEQILEL
jgi:hypothetical protein